MATEHIKGSAPRRPVILCFVAVYLPGYRSGGPVRTIANFVDHLGDDFDVRIVTQDRDALETAPYPGVRIDAWNSVGKAQVFYASARTINLRGIARLLRNTPHDVLYVNSFFAFGFTGLPLIARRIGLAPRVPCVIAPRGEFSTGAFAIKAWKKKPYIVLSKVLDLYSELHWQASSPFEATDIHRELGKVANWIKVAPNLPPKALPEISADTLVSLRSSGPLQIVFLSRISPMKNLDFLLEVLARVKSDLEFLIYGPIEDHDYWERCQSLVCRLPGNITVSYRGEVTPPEVFEAFSTGDVFVFATRGENYGHVVLESLVAGTSVLLSDRTPWQASGDNAVEVLPLEKPDAWVAAIERWAAFDDQKLGRMRLAASAYAKRYLESTGAVEQNKALFIRAVNSAANGANSSLHPPA